MEQRAAIPTKQELEIMKLIWELDNSTVRDVYEALRERRTIAYTTVMTMMNLGETSPLCWRVVPQHRMAARGTVGRQGIECISQRFGFPFHFD